MLDFRLVVGTLGAIAMSYASVGADNKPIEATLARGRALELPTAHVPPPGNPLEHHAAGFAQTMCSAVFITGLDADFAAENVGYFTAPYAERAQLGRPMIDRAAKTVSVAVPGGAARIARYLGDQGCVTYPIGTSDLAFTPQPITSSLPDPSTQPWPTGDKMPAVLPAPLSIDKVNKAVDAAFASPAGMTSAVIVTWRGHIIAERYGPGITARTQLESWSMGKSVTAALMGVLIRQGAYDLWQPAPIPEWQAAGDARAKISHCRSAANVERPAHPFTLRSRLRSRGTLPRASVPLHRQRRLLPLCRHATAAMATQYRGPLSQYRPCARQLSDTSGGRAPRRELRDIPSARLVRPDRRTQHGDRNRSFR